MDNEAVGVGNTDVALISVLKDPHADFDYRPEYQRLAVLTLLRMNQPDEAIRVLKQAIFHMPSYTPFWLDLATAFAAKGDKDSAISALVIAYNWAHKPTRLLQEYENAAQANGAMSALFRDAIIVANANTSALDQLDASVPQSTENPAPSKPEEFPRIDFKSCTKPQWPRTSLRYEETGSVTRSFLVGANGKLAYAKVIKSSGYVELDHAALVGMTNCPFIPGKKDGTPFTARAMMQYVWTIE
ncbi:MAG: TonB family protein [Pseudomonadota bacterium]